MRGGVADRRGVRRPVDPDIRGRDPHPPRSERVPRPRRDRHRALRPGGALGWIPPGVPLHRHDLVAPERRRVRGLSGRDAEGALELVAVVVEELVRAALDHDRLAEVGFGDLRVELLEGQLERALVLADRKGDLPRRDGLHQPPAGLRRMRDGDVVAQREARVDGLPVGPFREIAEKALQLAVRDVDRERNLEAFAAHTHRGRDGLGDVRVRAELLRGDANLLVRRDNERDGLAEPLLDERACLDAREPADEQPADRDAGLDQLRPARDGNGRRGRRRRRVARLCRRRRRRRRRGRRRLVGRRDRREHDEKRD